MGHCPMPAPEGSPLGGRNGGALQGATPFARLRNGLYLYAPLRIILLDALNLPGLKSLLFNCSRAHTGIVDSGLNAHPPVDEMISAYVSAK
jgi:hypothetical protein